MRKEKLKMRNEGVKNNHVFVRQRAGEESKESFMLHSSFSPLHSSLSLSHFSFLVSHFSFSLFLFSFFFSLFSPTLSAEEGFSVSALPDSVFARMQGKSYPSDCRIARSELRYVQVLYYGMDEAVHRGEIVCNQKIADDLSEIFRQLYEAHYPLGSVHLIDEFDANDERSMQANNTSCFCYRVVRGSTHLSKHAQGLAIDINPLYNPCVRTLRHGQQRIEPSTAAPYAHRTHSFPCRIDHQDLCYRLFISHGFRWGGDWRNPKDYQHFEK